MANMFGILRQCTDNKDCPSPFGSTFGSGKKGSIAEYWKALPLTSEREN